MRAELLCPRLSHARFSQQLPGVKRDLNLASARRLTLQVRGPLPCPLTWLRCAGCIDANTMERHHKSNGTKYCGKLNLLLVIDAFKSHI
jgi:hypothetical protein